MTLRAQAAASSPRAQGVGNDQGMPITYDAVKALSADLYDWSLRAVPADLRDLEASSAATTLAPAPTIDVTLEGAELFAAVRAASVAPVMVATRDRVVVGTVRVPDVVAALERR